MRKIFWVLLFTGFLTSAQDTQGYYITNDGVRHEMTIRASELESLNKAGASFVAKSANGKW